MPISRARNSGSSSSTAPPLAELAERARLLRVLLGDAVEELLGLGREQRDLLLLDEHRQHRLALARLDHERARAGLAERARADRVDGIELDGVGHGAGSGSGAASGCGLGHEIGEAAGVVALHEQRAVRVEVEHRDRRRAHVQALEQVEVHAACSARSPT